MIRGFYSAVSGMLSSVRRMEVVVNNLANLQTNGFKQERSASITFQGQLLAQLGGSQDGTPVGPLVLTNTARPPELDLSQGALHETGRTLDVALDGPGFLVVESEGGLAYTRDGSLTRDGQGFLSTATRHRILGQDGPIQLDPGEVSIREDGTVLVDDRAVARLRVAHFGTDQRFERLGNNLLVPVGPAGEPAIADVWVRQGFVEGSNVDLTGTMAVMLEVQRAYEANQRMIQYQDQMAVRAVNDIARPVS